MCGEFDPGGGPYAGITKDVVYRPEHRRLARQTAGKAMVLLKNANRTLPLDPGRVRSVAVVGPLVDTLYTDWYSGAMPYRITPLAGIRERLGGGATVTASEAVDRIALKEVTSGRYVSAGATPEGAPLVVSGASAGTTEQFDAFGRGQGVLTFRSVANGKVV